MVLFNKLPPNSLRHKIGTICVCEGQDLLSGYGNSAWDPEASPEEAGCTETESVGL